MQLLLQTPKRGLSLCLSVDHDGDTCKNDQDAVWEAHSCGSGESCVKWGMYRRHLANMTERSKITAMWAVATITVVTNY